MQTNVLEAQSEASDDGILVAAADGAVLRCNGQLQALWGLGPVGAGTPLGAVAAKIDAMVATPGDVLGDTATELVLNDGRTIDRYSAPIRGDDTTPYGRVWYFRDVTERKRLEREVMDVCEREQRRIGQDLHDGLGPHLVGVSMMAQALEAELAGAAPQHVESAGRIGQLIDDAIAQARGLARGLRPVALEEDGLATALQELAKNAARMYCIVCPFSADGDVELADVGTATHLYRITQEAVNNAVRHGRAKRVEIALTDVGQGVLRLSVADDGVGFDGTPPAESRGMGVHTMTYRAGVIGGSIRIAAAGLGGADRPGTIVEVTLPRPTAVVEATADRLTPPPVMPASDESDDAGERRPVGALV
ncbi:MAG TPA: sensor histidine kinase [Tepidisphaeraceae bacterium]|nr:sensor histidine kinase [Tepidisphaeraceae bacterium]